jgi:formylglycine-generating enzyme required for sulfatase activity/Fe-S cluster biogenesis protein NfuA
MGSETGAEFERPIHEVSLDAYWLDETPVTNAAFSAFVDTTGYRTEAERAGAAWGYQAGRYGSLEGLSWRTFAPPDRSDHPVVLVSWDDAAAYAAWAGKNLPTEAQWERAARAGVEQQAYPWGEELVDGSQCNFAGEAHETPATTPVRRFPPNPSGLYDMVGNVWQWCADWYGTNTYTESARANPTGPAAGTHRVRRGGAWNVLQPFRLRTANRGALEPRRAAPNVGFRCARAAQPSTATESIGSPDAAERLSQVEAVLQTVRLAMEADGGGVELVGIAGNVIQLRLTGTCTSCPSIELTLRQGLESALRRHLPWSAGVERVS